MLVYSFHVFFLVCLSGQIPTLAVKFHSRDYDDHDYDDDDGDVDDNASGLKVLGLYASGPKRKTVLPPYAGMHAKQDMLIYCDDQ